MNTTKRSERGLTLVEVMVSSIVGAIIAGGVLAILTAQNSALKEGTANARMHMQAIALSTLIGKDVRAGNLVLQQSESWSAAPSGYSQVDAAEMHIYGGSGTLLRAYRILNGSLQESTNGSNWSNFTVGLHAVKVASGGTFTLSADRRSVAFSMELTTTYRGSAHALSLKGDMHRCRS